jgi:hypothetical protein
LRELKRVKNPRFEVACGPALDLLSQYLVVKGSATLVNAMQLLRLLPEILPKTLAAGGSGLGGADGPKIKKIEEKGRRNMRSICRVFGVFLTRTRIENKPQI